MLRVDAEAADAAGVVVIFQHERVPARGEIPDLRREQPELEAHEIERLREEFQPEDTVAREVREVEDAVKLAGFAFDIAVRVLGIGRVGLPDRVGVEIREGAGAKLLQELVHARSVDEEIAALLDAEEVPVVAQGVDLGPEVEHVEAEARHALFQPEAHDVHDLVAHGGVLPVQVRLLRREEVQVKVVRPRDPRPRAAREAARPVRRRQELFSFPPSWADDVIVAVFALRIAQRLAEPRVLIARVVEHHVHDDAQTALFTLRHQPVEVLHRPERRVDRAVVRDVVAVVLPRRGVQRREPDRRRAEVPDIVELRDDAGDIADAVVIGVHEAQRIDLIHHRVLKPVRFLCHTFTTFRQDSIPVSL